MTKFTICKHRNVGLATGAAVWLAAGGAWAQTPDDTAAPKAAPPSGSIISAIATAPTEDGESSSSLEFVSPVRSITTAPRTAGTGAFGLVNPAENTLTDARVQMPSRESMAPLLAAPTSGAHSVRAKTLFLALLGVALATFTGAVRHAQGRSRTLG